MHPGFRILDLSWNLLLSSGRKFFIQLVDLFGMNMLSKAIWKTSIFPPSRPTVHRTRSFSICSEMNDVYILKFLAIFKMPNA